MPVGSTSRPELGVGAGEEPPDGGVVAVGGDDPPGAHGAPVGQRRGDRVVGGFEGHDAGVLADLDAAFAGEVDERGVELEPGHHARVGPAGGERDHDLAPDRRHEHGLGDRRVRRQGPHVEAEAVEQAQRSGGQAVAAGLVPGEAGLVDHDGVEPEPAGLDPGGDSRRTGADHQQVSHRSAAHVSTVPTFRIGVLIAARIRSSGGATGSSARPDAERPNEHANEAERSNPMNIAVCVKQIPDPAVPGTLEADHTLERAGKLILDDSDAYGVEMALQLADKAGGGEVVLISMAPNGEVSGLRTALAMGAARAVLVSDDALAGSDALSTAKVLAKAIERAGGIELVLTATESTDGYTGTIPGQVAELLGWPSLTFAKHVEVGDGKVTIQRQTEAGFDEVEASLPAVVSVTAGVVEPRYPSFKGIMAAKNKPVDQVTVADLGLSADQVGWAGARQKIVSVGAAPEREAGEKIEDDGEAYARIVSFLEQLKVV